MNQIERMIRWSGTRTGGLLLFASAVFLVSVLGSKLFGNSRNEFSTSVALRTAAEGPVWEPAIDAVENIRLKPGQQMEQAFREAGAPPEEVASLLWRLKDAIDVRRVKPSDGFRLYLTRDSRVSRLEYEPSASLQTTVLERAEDTFLVSVETKKVTRYLRKVEGTVEDNLFFSVARAGGNAALVVNFADLFAWDFDFFTDTRVGDRFTMLAEEVRVDGIPSGFGRILAARYLPVSESEPLAVYFHAWNEGKENGYYTADGKSVRKFFLKSPLNYRRISSTFTKSRFHPILKKHRPHMGIDYAAATGTPVVALGNGKVVSATWRGGYGRTVQIRHNRTYMTQYAHLSKYGKGIKAGVRVKQGQVIGYVGSSGMATGPHLDFRVQENGRWINPLGLKGGQSEPLPDGEHASFGQEIQVLDRLFQSLDPATAMPIEVGDNGVPSLALARLDTPSAS